MGTRCLAFGIDVLWTLPGPAQHPTSRSGSGLGRVTLRLPEPSQSEGDGLASDLTHATLLWFVKAADRSNVTTCVRAIAQGCEY
jgi:hypothetical protein